MYYFRKIAIIILMLASFPFILLSQKLTERQIDEIVEKAKKEKAPQVIENIKKTFFTNDVFERKTNLLDWATMNFSLSDNNLISDNEYTNCKKNNPSLSKKDVCEYRRCYFFLLAKMIENPMFLSPLLMEKICNMPQQLSFSDFDEIARCYFNRDQKISLGELRKLILNELLARARVRINDASLDIATKRDISSFVFLINNPPDEKLPSNVPKWEETTPIPETKPIASESTVVNNNTATNQDKVKPWKRNWNTPQSISEPVHEVLSKGVLNACINGLILGVALSAIGLLIRCSTRHTKEIEPPNADQSVQSTPALIPLPPTIEANNVPRWYSFPKGYRRLTFMVSLYITIAIPLAMLFFCNYHDAGDVAIGSIIGAMFGFVGTWLIAYIIKLIILPSIRYVKAGFGD